MMNYHGDQIMYGLGLTSLYAGLGMLIYSIYLLPFVFFGLTYPVPEFVHALTSWFQEEHGLKGILAMLAVFSPFFIGSCVLIYFARFITYRLDLKIWHEIAQEEGVEDKEALEETFGRDQQVDVKTGQMSLDRQQTHDLPHSMVVLLAIVGVVGLIFLLEYFVIIDMLT